MGVAQIANVISDPSTLLDLFKPSPKLIGNLEVDLILSETPIFSYDVTDHPVEAGLDVSDSRIERPIGLVLDCAFTDVPFDPLSTIGNAISGGLSFDTWQDKKAELYKLKGRHEFLTISTPLDTYFNMMITDIAPDVTPQNASGFFFRIEFKEVRVVSTAIADIDPSLLPPDLQSQAANNAKKAGKKKPKGKQNPATSGTGAGASILSKLLGGLV